MNTINTIKIIKANLKIKNQIYLKQSIAFKIIFILISFFIQINCFIFHSPQNINKNRSNSHFLFLQINFILIYYLYKSFILLNLLFYF
jgi:hypothetical protein